ncbi:MAG: hypothetical protein A3F84_11545 [Candidatus Handelsmanbacteria bacterium RIFCSPLOWO2_12_FULL_64_10]|uniref:Flavin reductase like domain-containing protein n=1 Tax=Handelsmanbacteria sp. (strain RIFCSPLOWO2_12_FULL_64_10) TaxID=1817868 RepID=A0A1F6C6F2_HANXR|nr:MAG: hypothetical protein A3F84_11545 [Candidatus Handelsmanbacteria bacterium RIFCSPLOWO2_12_FULL_64_10]
MEKVEAGWMDYFAETMAVMRNEGLLLASVGKDRRPNVMTIGWGTLGSVWGRPVFLVLVRPSRFTYGLLEQAGDFTVNVPPASLAETVAFCGMASGRQHDKFREKGLTASAGKRVRSPIVKECVIHYECRTIHRNDVVAEALAPDIRSGSYPKGDLHRVYFGEVLAVYADPDARERLSVKG